MAIIVECECGKVLRASDASAGKHGKCPGCGRKLYVAAPEPEPEPEPEPVESFEEIGSDQPSLDDLPSEPVPMVSTPAPVMPPVVVVESPRQPSRLRQYVYGVFLLALLPLFVHTLGKDADDVKDRFRHTLQSNPSVAQKLQSDGELSEKAFFAVLPEHRIEGAYLPHDTWAHWGLAGIAGGLYLGLLIAIFPGATAIARKLLIVGLFTGTLGILFLLIVQFLASWTQGFWIRGGGKIMILFYLLKFIGFSYRAALGDTGFLLSFLGFTCGVGLCEELCKALPLIYYFNRAGQVSWRTSLLLALASGIGFGVSEGITYSSDFYNGLHTGSIYVVRFVSCVALHAVWAASVGLSLYRHRAKLVGEEPIGAILASILIPMVLHGLYDTFLKKDMGVYAIATAVVSFAIMAWQIEKARQIYADEDEDLAAEATAA